MQGFMNLGSGSSVYCEVCGASNIFKRSKKGFISALQPLRLVNLPVKGCTTH